MNLENDKKRNFRTEKAAAALRAQLMETMTEGYRRAVEAKDEEAAADFCRKIRNKLLEESDNIMILDRMGLEVPTGSTFTAWLAFFRKFGDMLTGSWAIYRKALRDLPDQPGFPFDVNFPQKPEETE